MSIKNKLQDINNNISSLLSQFKYIYVLELNALPQRIYEIIIGENKMASHVDKTICEITRDDLRYAKTIPDYAFYNCTSLTSVTIPDSVITIESYVFHGCTSLANIYLRSITPPTISHALGIPTTTTIHVPVGSGDAYKSATNWSSFADNIVEDVEI